MRVTLSAAKALSGLATAAVLAVAVVATGDSSVPPVEPEPPPEPALVAQPLLGGPAPRPSAAAWRERCRRAHPLPAPTTAEGIEPDVIRELLRKRKDEPSLGSATIGSPTRGALFNGVQLQEREGMKLLSAHLAWGTETTIHSVERAVAEVRCRYPNSPPLAIGNVSRQHGGYFYPHRSHQVGLDADIGLFYRHGYDWYLRATEDNFDRERTWALVDALVAMDNVQYLFVDRRIKGWLEETAVAMGIDEERRFTLFEGSPYEGAIIRHARGHRDHIHVRFVDEAAEENAERLLPYLWGRYRYLAGR